MRGRVRRVRNIKGGSIGRPKKGDMKSPCIYYYSAKAQLNAVYMTVPVGEGLQLSKASGSTWEPQQEWGVVIKRVIW